MKTLILLRHAKSSWNDASLDDFDRPLNERGRKAAITVGKFLAKEKVPIDLVLSSPAMRARETSGLVLKASTISLEMRFDQRIYEASSMRLMEVVTQIDDDRNTVLLVGHNPGMEELLTLLTGKEERMQTAALATISLNVKKWERVIPGKGLLDSLIRVKELK
jgi:phosphohistidine phosphatase